MFPPTPVPVSLFSFPSESCILSLKGARYHLPNLSSSVCILSRCYRCPAVPPRSSDSPVPLHSSAPQSVGINAPLGCLLRSFCQDGYIVAVQQKRFCDFPIVQQVAI